MQSIFLTEVTVQLFLKTEIRISKCGFIKFLITIFLRKLKYIFKTSVFILKIIFGIQNLSSQHKTIKIKMEISEIFHKLKKITIIKNLKYICNKHRNIHIEGIFP